MVLRLWGSYLRFRLIRTVILLVEVLLLMLIRLRLVWRLLLWLWLRLRLWLPSPLNWVTPYIFRRGRRSDWLRWHWLYPAIVLSCWHLLLDR